MHERLVTPWRDATLLLGQEYFCVGGGGQKYCNPNNNVAALQGVTTFCVYDFFPLQVNPVSLTSIF